MYIIIVGGGKVGYFLTKELLNEGHEVLILEKDPGSCDKINEELGSICVRGDGCEITTLAEVGTARADMFIAVTDEDEDNLVSCQVAKHKFNVSRTIARISNPKNETLFRILGIDCIVSSTNLILEHIEEEVPTHSLVHLLDIKDKGLEIVEVKVPPGSRLEGKKVGDLSLPPGCILSLVLRESERPEVPNDNTILRANDRIIAVTTSETEEELRALLVST